MTGYHIIPPPNPTAPISVFPVQSDHGDVHNLIVCRANGDSITLSDYRFVYWKVTGKYLADDEIPMDWFAEEDRT